MGSNNSLQGPKGPKMGYQLTKKLMTSTAVKAPGPGGSFINNDMPATKLPTALQSPDAQTVEDVRGLQAAQKQDEEAPNWPTVRWD